MTEIDKRAAALALLARSRIRYSHYQPPVTRLLWRLGFNTPPPHFCGFFFNTILFAAIYGVVWGTFMWLVTWRHHHTPLNAAVIASVCGLAFGLMMATYYAYGKRKHKLPSWRALGQSA